MVLFGRWWFSLLPGQGFDVPFGSVYGGVQPAPCGFRRSWENRGVIKAVAGRRSVGVIFATGFPEFPLGSSEAWK